METPLDRAVDAFLVRRPLPGIAVAMRRSNGEEIQVVRGYADLDKGTPMRTDSVFRIASMSKLLVAVAVLQLMDEGWFGLDDKVDDLLASLKVRRPRPWHPPVTVRHLLTHTSGIAAWGNRRALVANERSARTGVRQIYGRSIRAVIPAHRTSVYSNHNYEILGQLVVDVTGHPFVQYVKDRITTPLGMSRTGYSSIVGEVSGYGRGDDGEFRRVNAPVSPLTASCEARSTLEDLARLAGSLLPQGSPSVLSPHVRRQLLAQTFRLHPHLVGRGICLASGSLAGQPFGQLGSFNAMYSGVVAVLPERDATLVVLANYPCLPELHVLADVALRSAEELPGPDEELDGVAVDRPVPPALLSWIEGEYRPESGYDPAGDDPLARDGIRLHVRAAAGRVRLDVHGSSGPSLSAPLTPARADETAFYAPSHVLRLSEGQSPCAVAFLGPRDEPAQRMVLHSFVSFRRVASSRRG